MVTACLIATTNAWAGRGGQAVPPVEDAQEEFYDSLDGPSEEEAYMQGRCSLICRSDRDGTNRFPGRQVNINSSSNLWGCSPMGRSRKNWPTGASI